MYTKERQEDLEQLRMCQDEASLWNTIIAFQNYPFFTATGLPFTYTIKRGKDGTYNKELLIDRKQNSKTLTWSSIRLACQKALTMEGKVVPKPKALGDIRGISYVYPLLWKFGIIEVPEKYAEKMSGGENTCSQFQ